MATRDEIEKDLLGELKTTDLVHPQVFHTYSIIGYTLECVFEAPEDFMHTQNVHNMF